MKKILKILLTGVTSLVLCGCFGDVENELEIFRPKESEISNDYNFVLDEFENATIISCKYATVDIVIPKYVGNINEYYKVVAISEKAFFNNTFLEKVKISEGIEKIGSHSFSYCERLKEITIPESLKEYGERVFSNCDMVEKFNLPDINYYFWALESDLFEKICIKKGDVYINDQSKIDIDFSNLDIEKIPSYAFENWFFQNIVFSDKLKIIEKYAFKDCTIFGYIVIPKNVTEIGEGAFFRSYWISNPPVIFCECSSNNSFEYGWNNLYYDYNYNFEYHTVYYAGEWEYVDGIPTPLIEK